MMTAIGRIIAFASKVALAAFGVIALIASGCGDRFAFEGTWNGAEKIVTKEGADPDIGTSLAKVVVKIGHDGRFQMRLETFDYAGSVAREGDKLVLNPETVFTMPIERMPSDQRITAEITPNADGTVTLQVNTRDPVVLRRQT